ncbi:reverse transcriptase domain-containing protein [Nocardioides plantarum]|uniref:Reverse transcriptase domain-containing protein n=1 Tax=Nocardioides plantarum TaxID=29299 RepID=A0ABV5K4I4_9ACTN|nr:reverse transcriptase domain-containing protein [Nocardioides plantarum]
MAAKNITVEEAALRLGLSVATVKRHLSQGRIAGQKIGGRWLVHADKLPTVTGVPTAASPAHSVDVTKALAQVMRTDRRELWIPDILHWEDFRAHPDEVLRAAQQTCVDGSVDPVEVVEVPKGDLLTRAGTLMSLPDRVAYHALCESFAADVEEALDDCVFSSRLDPRKGADFFKPGIQQWNAFQGAVAGASLFSTWIVETDLVSYFETISHEVLFRDLDAIGVDRKTTATIRRMLREWRRSSGHGLPIGCDASRLLGNFYLTRVDETMKREGYSYFRYMDDIRIVADSEIEALGALRRFEVLCRERALIVSGAKTKVEQISTRGAGTPDPIAMADYFFREGLSQTRVVLRKLFRDALVEKQIKVKHAKFALLRLGTLVDRGVLRRLIDRLDRLSVASPESAFYLRSFISEKKVQVALSKFLAGPSEPGMENYQRAWLLAAMLEVLSTPPAEWIDYARGVAWDANNPAYLRGLAMNLLALGQEASDLDKLVDLVSNNWDPALVRQGAAALRRVNRLEKREKDAILRRHPTLRSTVEYLGPRGSLPSLVQEGLWGAVRGVPNS